MILVQPVLDIHDLLALAQRLLADAHVFGSFGAQGARLPQRVDPRADAFGQPQPREAQRQRDAGDQRSDPQHARADEAEQLLAGAPERITDRPASVSASDSPFPLVQPRPFERRTRGEQQRQAEPEQPNGFGRIADGVRRFGVAAQQARQRSEPGTQRHRDRPPDRVAEHEVGEVREPGAERAGLVERDRRCAGCRKGRVASLMGCQRQHREQPQHAGDQQAKLRTPAGRRADDGGRAWRGPPGAGAGGHEAAGGVAVGTERAEWERHRRIVAETGAASAARCPLAALSWSAVP